MPGCKSIDNNGWYWVNLNNCNLYIALWNQYLQRFAYKEKYYYLYYVW